MPVKRRPLIKKPPTRARRSAVPHLLSSDQKRKLILAHAEARRPIDTKQRASVWAGVIVCMIFVVGAWIYTVGGTIKKTLASPADQNVRQVIDAGKEFTRESSDQWDDISQRLAVMAEQQVAVDTLIEQFSTSSVLVSSSTRGNVFQSNASSQASTLHSLPLSN